MDRRSSIPLTEEQIQQVWIHAQGEWLAAQGNELELALAQVTVDALRPNGMRRWQVYAALEVLEARGKLTHKLAMRLTRSDEGAEVEVTIDLLHVQVEEPIKSVIDKYCEWKDIGHSLGFVEEDDYSTAAHIEALGRVATYTSWRAEQNG
jgi:hypothetical protein